MTYTWSELKKLSKEERDAYFEELERQCKICVSNPPTIFCEKCGYKLCTDCWLNYRKRHPILDIQKCFACDDGHFKIDNIESYLDELSNSLAMSIYKSVLILKAHECNPLNKVVDGKCDKCDGLVIDGRCGKCGKEVVIEKLPDVKACPVCGFRFEHEMCNHVECDNCHCHFNFETGEILSKLFDKNIIEYDVNSTINDIKHQVLVYLREH